MYFFSSNYLSQGGNGLLLLFYYNETVTFYSCRFLQKAKRPPLPSSQWELKMGPSRGFYLFLSASVVPGTQKHHKVCGIKPWLWSRDVWPWYVAPIWAIEKVAGKMQLLLTATVRMLRCSEGGLGFISHYHSFKSCQYVCNEGDLCAESLRSNDNLSRTRYYANCPARCWSNSKKLFYQPPRPVDPHLYTCLGV